MTRYCAVDDQEVRPVAEANVEQRKTFGKGVPSAGYFHVGSSGGVPNCGRQFLEEHHTYTEGYGDGSSDRITEPQY